MSENSIIKQLRISRIIGETKDAKTFELKPIDWQPVYESGQFITFLFNTPFGEKRRSYSISSSPELDESLSITVKRQENGEFSRWMIEHVKEGELFYTTGISGFFILPEDFKSTEQFIFLAAGSGITPCFSLIKTLLISTSKKIILIYSNRTEAETIFFDQLNLLQKKYSERFTIIFLYSASQKSVYRRLNKDLLFDMLHQFQTSKEKTLFYLCGPFEYIRMCMISLVSYGVHLKNIRKENFNHLTSHVKIEPPDKEVHNVSLRIGNNSYSLNVKYPKSILATAKENNIQLPYSCEAGVCGSCVAKCIKGKIWMSYNEVLTDTDIVNGLILTCQGYPISGDAEILLNIEN